MSGIWEDAWIHPLPSCFMCSNSLQSMLHIHPFILCQVNQLLCSRGMLIFSLNNLLLQHRIIDIQWKLQTNVWVFTISFLFSSWSQWNFTSSYRISLGSHPVSTEQHAGTLCYIYFVPQEGLVLLLVRQPLGQRASFLWPKHIKWRCSFIIFQKNTCYISQRK